VQLCGFLFSIFNTFENNLKFMKTAIITGGAKGIGKKIAYTLMDNNIQPIVLDIDDEAGLKLDNGIFFIKADMSIELQIENAIKNIILKFGKIDFLINNVGIGIFKPILQLTTKEWNKVIATNLTSIFLCSKFCESELRKSRGQIINIASTRALMSEPNTEAYSASKGGVIALTHALAISLGPDVKVNCISPGWIEINDYKKVSQRSISVPSEADHKQHPAGRVGKPEDIANFVLYLLQQDDSFITGQNFTIDGGMTKKMIYL
jgi:NAD(P)-dependent dehydrogenase (short-subunit alcohol dehydrogenase family)